MPDAKYMKKKDGSWGVKLTGDLSGVRKDEAITVEVVTRAGERSTRRVAAFWIGPDNYGPGECALCHIIEDDGRVRGAGGDSGGNGAPAGGQAAQTAQARSSGSRRRSRPSEEGSSYPCTDCGGFCHSGDHGYCPNV